MHPASEHHIPDGLLAASLLLSEKPRHGVASKNPALHLGINEANSTAAIGLRAGLLLNRVQSRYTGKERDAESGLDFFGARYYGSTMGRWLSPDWAEKPEAVPYSSLDNPQSLNLYNYVGNNPLSKADADGHEGCCDTADGFFGATVSFAGTAGEVLISTAFSAAVATGAVLTQIVSPKALDDPAEDKLIANQKANAAAVPATSVTTVTISKTPAADGSKASATGDKTNTGPKAATAPGVTAGNQATNVHGQKLGPSGKPQVNNVESNTREGAKNAGNKGSGTVEHSNPKEGDPHFHTTRGDGTKVQDSTHYNYPK